MPPELALFFANVVSGIHLALIIFFLVGWLIPVGSFKYRVFAVIFLGTTFILFRFLGGCPLTVLEHSLRNAANGGTITIQQTFIEAYLSNTGIAVNRNILDILSFNLSLTIPILASAHYGIVLFYKKKKST